MTHSSPPVVAALAAGFRAAGVRICANHPGFHSHTLAAALGGTVTSRSERSAMEFGWGASLAGARTVVTLKNVGLNDAADPFINSLFVGCHGGLVVTVFDDIEIEQSQLRLDSRMYALEHGGIWVEPRSVADAGRWAARSFDLAEQFGAPVVIRITNILCHAAEGAGPVGEVAYGHRSFLRSPARWVVHPANVASLRELQAARLARIQAWSDAEPFACGSLAANQPLTLVFGAAPSGERASENWVAVDRLPLPAGVIDAARRAQHVTVREHGHGYVAAAVGRAMAGESVESAPFFMPDLPRVYHKRNWYEPLFGALRRIPDRIVIGDLGSHTMDEHRTIDACLCYGGSVSVAAGVAAAAPALRVICVRGDGGFAHSGAAGLAEMVDRGLTVVVFVMDNGGCQDTGGQWVSCDWPQSSKGLRIVDREYGASRPCPVDEIKGWFAAGGVTVVRCRFPDVWPSSSREMQR